MYNATVKTPLYTSGSVCADNCSMACRRIKPKSSKITAQKRNEFEIKLICILLIFGNVLVMKKISPAFDTFFGYFLQATIGISSVLIGLRSIVRKIIK